MSTQPLFTIVESQNRFYVVARSQGLPSCRAISVGFASMHDARNALAVATAAYMIGVDVALEQFSQTLREARIAS